MRNTSRLTSLRFTRLSWGMRMLRMPGSISSLGGGWRLAKQGEGLGTSYASSSRARRSSLHSTLKMQMVRGSECLSASSGGEKKGSGRSRSEKNGKERMRKLAPARRGRESHDHRVSLSRASSSVLASAFDKHGQPDTVIPANWQNGQMTRNFSAP
jgi:hypothetical protein